MQVVSEPPQVLFLPLGQRHRRIIGLTSRRTGMARRSKSSGRWLAEHFADPYVRRARDEGMRSRATFKLEEIDDAENLVRPGTVIVDLGAAPGGWSQYAARKLRGRGRIIALDLLPLDAIAGVTVLQGDFREQSTLDGLLAELEGEPVDLVLSDMAPNISGVDVVDQARAADLEELALDFALKVLGPDGTLVMKVFQGAGFQQLLAEARKRFTTVRMRKPRASRARSSETYLVARRPRPV
jgi:23S rRNA (uridine2552-2'-O)-methyltransferase